MLGTQSALQKVHLWQKVDVGGNVYAAEVRANVPNAVRRSTSPKSFTVRGRITCPATNGSAKNVVTGSFGINTIPE